MTKMLTLRFYHTLNDFLPPDQKNKTLSHPLTKARSVKDLIESIGIPHTEVDLIVVNGEAKDFSYPVKNDDHIHAYPAMQRPDLFPSHHCQPETPQTPLFILDVHLGKLAAYLRMTGFDTLYRNDYDDPDLAAVSAGENRILLTCDRKLLMRKQVTRGYFVRNRQPALQRQEIFTRYRLYDKIRPFSRCMHCNGLTQAVDKKEIEEQLQAKTRQYYDTFYRCNSCGKIYWKGSHYLKMQAMIEQISARKQP